MSITTGLFDPLWKPGNAEPSGKNGTHAMPSAVKTSSMSSCERSIHIDKVGGVGV